MDHSGPRRQVFVVHGRDAAARAALVTLLRAFDLRVIGWEEAVAATGQATPYTGDVVAAGMRLADAVVVLLTPDDVGQVQPHFRLPGDGRHELEPSGQARLNVVFEAGMAMALDRSKVVLVEVGQVRPMSDTAGLNVVRLTNDVATRRQLGARLRTAGLDVDMEHDDWRDAGAFDQRPRTGKRRASITERLIEHHVLAEGQELTIVVPVGVGEDAAVIAEWLSSDRSRQLVQWRNNPAAPLYWAVDGSAHSMAGLIRELVKRATDQEPRTQVWGPNWVRTSDGTTLARLAETLP